MAKSEAYALPAHPPDAAFGSLDEAGFRELGNSLADSSTREEALRKNIDRLESTKQFFEHQIEIERLILEYETGLSQEIAPEDVLKERLQTGIRRAISAAHTQFADRDAAAMFYQTLAAFYSSLAKFYGPLKQVSAPLLDRMRSLQEATDFEGDRRPGQDLLNRAAALAASAHGQPEAIDRGIDQLFSTNQQFETYFGALGSESAAAFVRAARQAAGLTQKQLAQRIGVSQPRIAELERGEGSQGPTISLLARVAQACGKKLSLMLE